MIKINDVEELCELVNARLAQKCADLGYSLFRLEHIAVLVKAILGNTHCSELVDLEHLAILSRSLLREYRGTLARELDNYRNHDHYGYCDKHQKQNY